MPYPYCDRVIRHLWARADQRQDQYLYAILDAARSEEIYPALVESSIEYRCLYKRNIPQVLAEAAPYLVRFHQGAPFLNQVVEQGWGESWGIFLISTALFKELAPHFREFIMARDANGNIFYFRYYDPRVLRVYLPTCNSSELDMIFGPVDYYFVEEEDGKGIIDFSFDGSALVRRYIGLEKPDEEPQMHFV